MSGRLPAVRPRQVIKVLEVKGWRLARSKGSHHHFTHRNYPAVISVPVHPGDIKRGTLAGILKDAGISRDEFRRLL